MHKSDDLHEVILLVFDRIFQCGVVRIYTELQVCALEYGLSCAHCTTSSGESMTCETLCTFGRCR